MSSRARIPGPGWPLLTILLSASLATAAETTAPDLGALAAIQAQRTSLAGSFMWSIQKDGDARHQIGAFALDRTAERSRYEVRMSNPDGSELKRWCSDGTQSWQIEQLLEGETPDVLEGENPDIRRVIACVWLDLPLLEKDFAATYDPTAETLTLTPRDQALARSLATVTVRLKDHRPLAVILEDPQQGRIVVTLADVTMDQPVDERRFRR